MSQQSPSKASYHLPPPWTRWGVWAVPSGLLLMLLATARTVDHDTFHEMALIREALALGELPREDVFAFTSTVSPSVHHEWGTGAVVYFITVALGLGSAGLVLLRFLLLGGTIALCFAIARRRGSGGLERALVAPLALLLFIPGLAMVRAHAFTFLFLAALLYLLERDRAGSRSWLLAWFPLQVLWVNLHGGWVVGVGMLGLYWVESLIRLGRGGRWRSALADTRHLLAATLGALPLVLINPYGAQYVSYLWRALLMERPYIADWAPLWAPPYRLVALPLFAASLLVLAYTIRGSTAWKKMPGILLLLVAAVFAARSVRILPIYTVAWMAYVPPALVGTRLTLRIRTWWLDTAGVAGAVGLGGGIAGLLSAVRLGLFTAIVPGVPGSYLVYYPVGPVEYLERTEFSGNLMTPFRTGAFVSWHLYPRVRVGMDSRYEVAYDPALVEETVDVFRGATDWQPFLERHGADAVLVSVDDSLDTLMAEAQAEGSRAWQEVYRDDGFSIFVRAALAENLPQEDRTGEPIMGEFP